MKRMPFPGVTVLGKKTYMKLYHLNRAGRLTEGLKQRIISAHQDDKKVLIKTPYVQTVNTAMLNIDGCDIVLKSKDKKVLSKIVSLLLKK